MKIPNNLSDAWLGAMIALGVSILANILMVINIKDVKIWMALFTSIVFLMLIILYGIEKSRVETKIALRVELALSTMKEKKEYPFLTYDQEERIRNEEYSKVKKKIRSLVGVSLLLMLGSAMLIAYTNNQRENINKLYRANYEQRIDGQLKIINQKECKIMSDLEIFYNTLKQNQSNCTELKTNIINSIKEIKESIETIRSEINIKTKLK